MVVSACYSALWRLKQDGSDQDSLGYLLTSYLTTTTKFSGTVPKDLVWFLTLKDRLLNIMSTND